MLKIKTLALALALALALVIGSTCAHAAEPFTVLLDWSVNPDHAGLVIAKEKGYYADAGLTIDLIAPADPNDPPKLLAAGKADIALSYQPQLYQQIEEGLPVVRVGTLIATPLNTLLTLSDGPIKKIADLKGRKIGYSVAGFEETLLSTMLATAGLKLSDVTLINVNFALLPPLYAGQVDAVIGGYRNVELLQTSLDKHPATAFYPEEYGVPPYDELIIEAHKDHLNDPRLRKFLDATERGTLYVLNHLDEAWEVFIKSHPELNDEPNKAAWAASLRRLSASPSALDSQRYQRFAAYMKAQSLIKNVSAVSLYAVEVK